MNRILLIDDDRHANEALAAALTILGYTSKVVCDGESARKIAEEFDPDVAIVDLMLPRISGLDVISHLTSSSQRLYCSLATGMPDFALLKRAISGGAWTLLGKPFQLSHLSGMLQTAAVMHAARELMLSLGAAENQDTVTITRRGETPVNIEDVARAMRFAKQWGADDDVSLRRLPIVVYELLTNARVHGTMQSSDQWYRLQLANRQDSVQVRVSDSGNGFDWRKELSRARTGWDKSKATGLQLVSAICDEITFGGDDFTVAASVSKMSGYVTDSAKAAEFKRTQ